MIDGSKLPERLGWLLCVWWRYVQSVPADANEPQRPMFNEPVVAGEASFKLLHDGGNGAWLASLIPFVHQVFATASYQSVFIGTCFVTTPEGHFVSARHVVEEAWKFWTETNHDSTVGHWAPLARSGCRGHT